jgi:hypothetical protein
MPHGLVLFDSEERLIVSNSRYFEMYGISDQGLHPGCTYREVVAARARLLGDIADVDAFCSARRRRMRRGRAV